MSIFFFVGKEWDMKPTRKKFNASPSIDCTIHTVTLTLCFLGEVWSFLHLRIDKRPASLVGWLAGKLEILYHIVYVWVLALWGLLLLYYFFGKFTPNSTPIDSALLQIISSAALIDLYSRRTTPEASALFVGFGCHPYRHLLLPIDHERESEN